MTETDDLINEILTKKPELTKEVIMQAARQKMDNIGSGFLSEQGALHLIAADFDVNLTPTSKSTINNLLVGSKQVSIDVKIMSVSSLKTFTRKDGTAASLRSITVYDNTGVASIKIWDSSIPFDEKSFKVESLIRITNANVKTDLDGSNALHLGSDSNIELLDEESDIVALDELIKDLGEIKEATNHVVVRGIPENINTLEYVNSKTKQPSKALRMTLKGKDNMLMRTIIWGQDESIVPKVIAPNSMATLYDVNIKMGNQNSLEIHGNNSTTLQMEGKSTVDDMTLRLLSISKGRDRSILSLAVDEKKKIYTIIDSSGKLGSFQQNDAITCIPDTLRGSRLTLTTDSYIGKSVAELPSVSDLRTKIHDIEVNNDYCVEGIVLKINDPREIQTRRGESIQLAEMLVEDDTGQLWVKGWREQSRLIADIALGEVLSILGVTAKPGMEGKKDLMLNAFSQIIKKD